MSSKSVALSIGFAAVVGLTLFFNNCQPVATSIQMADNSSLDASVPGAGGGTPGGGTIPGGGAPLPEAQAYFLESVVPAFNNACIACHVRPQLVTGVPAPLTIFNYSNMRAFLMSAPSTSNNALIQRMQGVVAHTGGNQCPGIDGLNNSPCKEVVNWKKIEDPFAADGGISGAISYISPLGRITGWALDPADPTQFLNLQVYIDGPIGVGTQIASISANQAGVDSRISGHYFNYELPAAYKNGQAHQLYVYAGDPADDALIPGTPKTFAAYTPSTQGRDFYNANVLPFVQNRCSGCHSVNYDIHYLNLLNPTPIAGGTATDNELINYMSGGNGHAGGNFCGNKNAGTCLQLQQWWAIEFN